MDKIEHLGIAVRSIADTIPIYEALLGTTCYKIDDVASEGVRTAFFQIGPNKVELLESTNENSAIQKFLSKKGEGLHHIALSVTDINAEMQRLKAAGFSLLNDKPKVGADGKLICFLHPKDTTGVLIELCMDNPDAQENLYE